MENKYYFFKKMYKDYVVILESKGKYKSFGYDKELIKYIKNKDINYVTAYCELRKDIRHFEIERIENIK